MDKRFTHAWLRWTFIWSTLFLAFLTLWGTFNGTVPAATIPFLDIEISHWWDGLAGLLLAPVWVMCIGYDETDRKDLLIGFLLLYPFFVLTNGVVWATLAFVAAFTSICLVSVMVGYLFDVTACTLKRMAPRTYDDEQVDWYRKLEHKANAATHWLHGH